MRDLRIGAALAVTFASLLAASIAFAQQPAQQPVQNPTAQNPVKQLKKEDPAVGENPPPAPGHAERLFKHTDDLASAKESPIKAENDKRWWLDRGTALSGEQKQKIHQAIAGRSDIRVPASPDLHPQASAVIPAWVVLSDLPDELMAEIPYIRNFKVVLTENKVLLINPTGRSVATVIDDSSTDEIKK